MKYKNQMISSMDGRLLKQLSRLKKKNLLMKFLQTVQLFIELNILSKPQQWISQNNEKISFNYNYI